MNGKISTEFFNVFHKTILSIHNVLSVSFKKFLEDDCFTLASSIAFIFLFSFIPFSVLNILFIRAIQGIVSSHGIWPADFVSMLADEIIHVIPFISKEWVINYVLSLNISHSFRIINYLMLPIISGFIFQTLEISYRKIFKLPRRHLLWNQAIYSIGSIFCVLLLFISNFMWVIISTAAIQLLNLIPKTTALQEFFSTILTILEYSQKDFISLVILILFYLATVKIFLNIRIHLIHRFIAAILFCCFWILARILFGIYIDYISKVNVLYGSIGSVMVILLWVYYSSVALLYAVEVMYSLHSDTGSRKRSSVDAFSG